MAARKGKVTVGGRRVNTTVKGQQSIPYEDKILDVRTQRVGEGYGDLEGGLKYQALLDTRVAADKKKAATQAKKRAAAKKKSGAWYKN